MTVLVTDLIRVSANRFPDQTAVIDGERRCSYAELRQRVDELAEEFAASGLLPGDRVLLLLENSLEYVVAYLASMRAGAIAVPYSHQATGRSVKNVVTDCTPSTLCCRAEQLKACIDIGSGLSSVRSVFEANLSGFERRLSADSEERTEATVPEARGDGTDIALMLYTSGTAGQPKGVMLTHRNLLANAASIVSYLKLTYEDRGMVILPFHYSYGNSLLTTYLMAGATLVLENGFAFPNVALIRMREEGVTGFAGVPSTFAILLNRSSLRNEGVPTLRYVTQAGGAMSPALALQLREALPGVEIYIMYGQTEATARLTYLDPKELFRKPGSIGKAIPGVRITLRKENVTLVEPGDVGEIVVEGDNVMAGYWNSPEDTASVLRNGVLHTGDLAYSDAEGFLYIVGRRSEMIKTGGHRVSPKEIEEVIAGIPGVHGVAVVGAPDGLLGQAIRAFIEREKGATVSEKDVLRHCAANLEPHLLPRDIVFLAELPKSSSGKIDRASLKSWAPDGASVAGYR